MLRNARGAAAPAVLLCCSVLCACPQLLSDDFDTLQLDAAGGVCGAACGGAASAGSAGAAGQAGVGGAAGSVATGGDGGTAGSAAGAGGSGQAGAGGSGATGGSVGTGGSSPDASAAPPACWTLELEDNEHDTSSNCLGIEGWNDVSNNTGSSVVLTHASGDACLAGTVAPGTWGAVFNMTFDGEEERGSWNAAELGVGGFALRLSGSALPPALSIIYTAGTTDYCRTVSSPGPDVSVPFDSTHPDCQATGAVPDATAVGSLHLDLRPAAQSYTVDFCVELRAIP